MWTARSRAILFEAREQRVHPLKDDKVLTDWNGLMIAALAVGARAFDEPSYALAAERAGEFVFTQLRDAEGNLRKRWRQGESAFPAMLEDYAFHGLSASQVQVYASMSIHDGLSHPLLQKLGGLGTGVYMSCPSAAQPAHPGRYPGRYGCRS